jgi:hypothetical protein
MNLQAAFELDTARQRFGASIRRIPRHHSPAGRPPQGPVAPYAAGSS